ncbi:MAG: DMT family transporter [candidate division Zixibacteria bacterium]
MIEQYFGEFAGLATALCWAVTSIFFTVSGTRIGSVNVNRLRLLLAVVFLSLTNYLLIGEFLPIHTAYERWFWLGFSGIIGFVIGDAMLFEAFVVVGTRISMLLMSLVPIMSGLFAWIFLGEVLDILEISAITLTVAGITWVVADKNRDKNWIKGKKLIWGIALGIGGALGQTFGLILSKKGLEGGYPALSGNLIRVIVAVIIIWLITIIRGKAGQTIKSLKDKIALKTLFAGSFFGPFLGVWLSLVAIKYARIGIASTLMATTPIILIPLAHWIFKDRVTTGSIIGTIIAIAGVALLILSAN